MCCGTWSRAVVFFFLHLFVLKGMLFFMKSLNHAHQLGKDGEYLALKTLQAKGWKIVVTNWRPAGSEHGLEIDIVAFEKKTLVFVEVKTRSRHNHKDSIPTLAAFTPKKQRTLIRAARQYLATHDLWDCSCRFDLICLDKSPEGQYAVEHFSNVIELGNFVDSEHASWQPW